MASARLMLLWKAFGAQAPVSTGRWRTDTTVVVLAEVNVGADARVRESVEDVHEDGVVEALLPESEDKVEEQVFLRMRRCGGIEYPT
jgi:hypothetical protein